MPIAWPRRRKPPEAFTATALSRIDEEKELLETLTKAGRDVKHEKDILESLNRVIGKLGTINDTDLLDILIRFIQQSTNHIGEQIERYQVEDRSAEKAEALSVFDNFLLQALGLNLRKVMSSDYGTRFAHGLELATRYLASGDALVDPLRSHLDKLLRDTRERYDRILQHEAIEEESVSKTIQDLQHFMMDVRKSVSQDDKQALDDLGRAEWILAQSRESMVSKGFKISRILAETALALGQHVDRHNREAEYLTCTLAHTRKELQNATDLLKADLHTGALQEVSDQISAWPANIAGVTKLCLATNKVLELMGQRLLSVQKDLSETDRTLAEVWSRSDKFTRELYSITRSKSSGEVSSRVLPRGRLQLLQDLEVALARGYSELIRKEENDRQEVARLRSKLAKGVDETRRRATSLHEFISHNKRVFDMKIPGFWQDKVSREIDRIEAETKTSSSAENLHKIEGKLALLEMIVEGVREMFQRYDLRRRLEEIRRRSLS